VRKFTKLTEYDIVDATPFKRDSLKELAEECKKAGITFCVYYSIVDWHYPDFPVKYSQIRREFPDGFHGDPKADADINRYAAYMRGQVRELLTNYENIGILWFDRGGSFGNYGRKKLLHSKEMVEMIHTLQPGCLINNRLGFGADYGTPEQVIPESTLGTAFEVCMTLNKHWGYNKNDHEWKNAETIVRNLVDVASKGGNYLLNVGPTAEGVIPEESVAILKEVGAWLNVNGEAVYGTTSGPSGANIRLSANERMTVKPGKLFLHIFDWPKDQKIFMTGMKGGIVKKIYLLADKGQTPLRYEPHERSLWIYVPTKAPSQYSSVIVVEYNANELLEEGNS
jgi:alpha-L-fucosidase